MIYYVVPQTDVYCYKLHNLKIIQQEHNVKVQSQKQALVESVVSVRS